ncbi:hypothetical protein [Sulfobacillus thermosulfidooxidans]|uniref:hypothetical protein n=1 Tax=Sulfobacillus thermosulfidooxidans TaxID=28034 RepID=UPI00096B73FE|nr:hypothetical protein [Sulfobacillus thermosulfidooxidans]OLZ08506.1 hypothetical protein BFX05_02955 [Sulfobacillus thermosulfidooxidans]OLZ13108.1 hypothetical protein BFX06_11205 [Sulfobacillus thermosulfidooxidans]OLZ21488.1 hypothetical protein BFX07_11630 [Sulfobacillus thermosulfidooxidans]
MGKPQHPWIDLLKQDAPYSKKTIGRFRWAGIVTVLALGLGYWAIFRALSGRLSLFIVMGIELLGLLVMLGALGMAIKSRQDDIRQHQSQRDKLDK